MNKKSLIAILIIAGVVYASSCYNNKEDIPALTKVSFRQEVVPIVTGSACGCHNNGNLNRGVQFSHLDTIFYDAILARVSVLDTMARFDRHPGAGTVRFTDAQKAIITAWVKQGGKDDANGDCAVPAVVTYTTNIAPIYNQSCKGSTCHGGLGPNLTYSLMVTDKDKLTTMMNSGGTQGHPAGTISLSSCTIKYFKAWLSQNQPQ